MAKKSNLLLAIFGGSLFLAACGDDVTKVTQVTQETSGLEVVASADSLGKCLAENVGEMKFVQKENAVYVCGDSAWQNVSETGKDGSDGKDGMSCTVELLADSSGYKIVCGGDSVGVVTNGNDGKKGESGMAGTSCTVTESPLLDSDFGGGYLVICGSDTVGMLVNGREGENCSLTDNGDGSVTQVCGASEVTLYKGFCGGKPFDPDSNVCYEDFVYSLCNGKLYDRSKKICDTRDGSIYKFVTIGSQIWMAENLNYAYMPDSLSFCYNDSMENCEKYGRLYTMSATREVCPEGWHLPSEAEWETLKMFVADSLFGGNKDSVGYALKSTSDWNYSPYFKSGNGSDSFGFGALPAGFCFSDGDCSEIFDFAKFWSYPEKANYAVYFYLEYAFTALYLGEASFSDVAISIRCVKD